MATTKMTKAGLRAFLRTIAPGQTAYLWDNGLGAKGSVDADGKAILTFVFKGRVKGGKARWRSLGDDDLDQAEKQASIWRGVIAAGGDPFAEIEAKAQARRDAATATVAAKAAAWMEWNTTKEKPIAATTAQDYRTMLDRHVLPAIGNRPIAEVNAADMARLRSRFVATPTLGNRVRAVLSSLFTFAKIPSPVIHFDKFREHQRERELQDDELMKVGAALRAMEAEQAAPVHAIAAVRAMLLTGARPGEVVSLKWDQVDLERAVIRLGKTKAGRRDPRAKLGLPITAPLALLLRDLPRVADNPYVFAGHRQGSHVWTHGDVWKEAVRRSGIDCTDPDTLKPYVARHTMGGVAGDEHSQAAIAGIWDTRGSAPATATCARARTRPRVRRTRWRDASPPRSTALRRVHDGPHTKGKGRLKMKEELGDLPLEVVKKVMEFFREVNGRLEVVDKEGLLAFVAEHHKQHPTLLQLFKVNDGAVIEVFRKNR